MNAGHGDGTPLHHNKGVQREITIACSICGMDVPAASLEIHRLAEEYILERIRVEHPEWVEADGACPKCLEFYEAL